MSNFLFYPQKRQNSSTPGNIFSRIVLNKILIFWGKKLNLNIKLFFQNFTLFPRLLVNFPNSMNKTFKKTYLTFYVRNELQFYNHTRGIKRVCVNFIVFVVMN